MSDLYRANIMMTTEGVACENVIYATCSLGAEALCDELRDYWIWPMRSVVTSTTHFDRVNVREMGHLILDPDAYDLEVDLLGTRNDERSDPQLAALVQIHTGLSGRKRRGRVFISGIADNGVVAGRLTSGEQLNINTQLDVIKERLITGHPVAQLQVFSRTIYNSLTDIILDSYKPATGFTVNPVLSTMRSRKPGG